MTRQTMFNNKTLLLLVFCILIICAQGFLPSRQRHALDRQLWHGRVLASGSGPSDDDCWGDSKDINNNNNKSVQMSKELEALKEQRSVVSQQQQQRQKEPPERDLFIPIFTLVAIAGFTGAYGYEMFRLYSNGELYLPF